MMTSVRPVIVASALCVAACPSTKERPQTWVEFFDRYCDYAAPCCEELGRSGSARRCREQTFYFDTVVQFSPKPAAACLDALDSGRFPGDFCSDPGRSLFECLNTPIDSRPLGAKCEVSTECAPESEGYVHCAGAYWNEIGVCQHVLTGVEDAAPCYRFDIDDPVPPPRAYDCSRFDGLFCNSIDRRCTRVAELGGVCWDESMCVDGAYCDLARALCVEAKPADEPCEGGIPFECNAPGYCHYDTRKCVGYTEEFATCTEEDEDTVCASFNCVDGRCAPYPDFYKSILEALCPSK